MKEYEWYRAALLRAGYTDEQAAGILAVAYMEQCTTMTAKFTRDRLQRLLKSIYGPLRGELDT